MDEIPSQPADLGSSETSANTENTIVCLNYCMTDPETGYCLTCGRPPAPVVAFSPRFFGRLSLANMTVIETTPEVSGAPETLPDAD